MANNVNPRNPLHLSFISEAPPSPAYQAGVQFVKTTTTDPATLGGYVDLSAFGFGSGTINQIPKWAFSTTWELINSTAFDDGAHFYTPSLKTGTGATEVVIDDGSGVQIINSNTLVGQLSMSGQLSTSVVQSIATGASDVLVVSSADRDNYISLYGHLALNAIIATVAGNTFTFNSSGSIRLSANAQGIGTTTEALAFHVGGANIQGFVAGGGSPVFQIDNTNTTPATNLWIFYNGSLRQVGYNGTSLYLI